MSKNLIQDGNVLSLIAPTGGVTAGVPVAIGALVVVPQETVAQALPFQGHTGGVWQVGCATGLLAGAKVSIKLGALVADGTASSVPCGHLVSDESAGIANFRLQN